MAKTYTASTDINATPETIWDILTTADKYPEWDTNMISLDGTIAPNEQLTIRTHLDPNRAFKPTVTVFEPPRKMVWQSGMPLGLFTGARTFTLQPHGDHVHFTLTETFSGPLLGVFGGSIPDMTPVFQEFAAALKARAESR